MVRRHSWSFNSPNKTIHGETTETKGTLVLEGRPPLESDRAGEQSALSKAANGRPDRRGTRFAMRPAIVSVSAADDIARRSSQGRLPVQAKVTASKISLAFSVHGWSRHIVCFRPRVAVLPHRLCEVHDCKVMLDEIFERECFQNEIIWGLTTTEPRQPGSGGKTRQHTLVHEGSYALHLQPKCERQDSLTRIGSCISYPFTRHRGLFRRLRRGLQAPPPLPTM